MQVKPTFMSGITLSSENQTADVVDLDWRSINVADPLTLTTPYGEMDINSSSWPIASQPFEYGGPINDY